MTLLTFLKSEFGRDFKTDNAVATTDGDVANSDGADWGYPINSYFHILYHQPKR